MQAPRPLGAISFWGYTIQAHVLGGHHQPQHGFKVSAEAALNEVPPVSVLLQLTQTHSDSSRKDLRL